MEGGIQVWEPIRTQGIILSNKFLTIHTFDF
jgi:hypothetical protein